MNDSKEKKPVEKASKKFEPKVMKELEAIKLTDKIMSMDVTNPENPMGKLKVELLDPDLKGKVIKCSKMSAIDWIVTGYGKLVD